MKKNLDFKGQGLRNKIIYQAFVRNYTESGTFKEFEEHLQYIKDLGTDILYLLPVNPIGKKARKGVLGSPYAIKDYMSINRELGTLKDFTHLIAKTHKLEMKLMIDVVFNHTSRDAKLLKEHPEWFYKDINGKFGNKAGDWADVYDLDFTSPGLAEYILGVLEYYCSLGVDGFRFDVASLVGSSLYELIKTKLLKKYPNTILLAESVHSEFTKYLRTQDFHALCDAQLAEYGFDLLYGYNTFGSFEEFFRKKNERYLDHYRLLLSLEEAHNPAELLRARGFENHDQPRLIQLTKDSNYMKNLAAMPVFMKGPMFIYNGLETKADHQLSLFDKDLLDLTIDKEWLKFITSLIQFKKNDRNLELVSTQVDLNEGLSIVMKNIYKTHKDLLGIFIFGTKKIKVTSSFLLDGKYKNYFDGQIYTVKKNSIKTNGPLILERLDK